MDVFEAYEAHNVTWTADGIEVLLIVVERKQRGSYIESESSNMSQTPGISTLNSHNLHHHCAIT